MSMTEVRFALWRLSTGVLKLFEDAANAWDDSRFRTVILTALADESLRRSRGKLGHPTLSVALQIPLLDDATLTVVRKNLAASADELMRAAERLDDGKMDGAAEELRTGVEFLLQLDLSLSQQAGTMAGPVN